MAELTTILPISADSVRMFLDWDEIEETRYLESQVFPSDTVLPQIVIYKNFGEIYNSDMFKIHVIFRNGNDSIGRDYKFVLRTYSLDWEIIDSYDLAKWKNWVVRKLKKA